MGQGRTRTKVGNASFVDDRSGEVITGLIEYEEKSGAPRQRSKEPFAVTYTVPILELSEYPLSGRDRVVIDVLMASMGYNEPFKLPSVTEIAELAHTTRRVVYQSLERLREYGLLIDATPDRVLLNPRIWWRGGEEERRGWIISLGLSRPDSGA